MKGKAAWLGVAVMTAVIGIALVGCATGPSSTGQSQEDYLKGGGFRQYNVYQDRWDPQAQQMWMDSQGGG